MTKTLTLPLPSEPVTVKESLIDAEPRVRRASLRQASDIVTPIFHDWKDQLKVGEISWQHFQAAASNNAALWESWLDGSSHWRAAVVGLLDQINLEHGEFQFRLQDV